MTNESQPSNDRLAAELSSLRENMDTKLNGLERVISDMREWMSRLTDTVERQSENRDRVVGLEHRVGHLEAENMIQRDMLRAARDQQIRSGVIIAIVASIGTTLFGAGAAALAGLVFV